MDNLNKIDTAAKIRLLIFALIILWGAYLSVYYSWKIYDIRFHDGLLNVSEAGNTNTQTIGSLLTAFAKIVARSVNVSASFILTLIYAALILVFTMVPMFIFRITALKDEDATFPEEAGLGNMIMICAFILVVILGILVTEGTVFLPELAFSLMWYASGFLCYITQIKGQTLD